MKELVLVIPVYNEEACIADVIESWLMKLAELGIDFQMLILNDGSRDGTADILKGYAANRNIEIVNKKNSGHGPTILSGYSRAVEMAEWVFQCDSDNEMQAAYFDRLWRNRGDYDALFGCRENRDSGYDRGLITLISRIIVWVFFGSRVRDVNVPYRLMRSSLLREIVAVIPEDTLSPNLLIAGAFSRLSVRVTNHPVPHVQRRTGVVSIRNWKLWRIALISAWQTCRYRKLFETS